MEILKQFMDQNQQLIQRMKNCSHYYGPVPNPYHLEDDVWSHTLLVFQQSLKYSKLIQICALLHDIGKIDTRKVNFEKGRTSFYGHAGVSAWKSLDILKKFDLSNEEIILTFKLIASHMDYHLLSPEKAHKRHCFDSEFFCNFIRMGECDDFGRFSDDERKEKYTPETLLPVIFRDSASVSRASRKVTLLIGPPCSGKSSYVDSEAPLDSLTLSRDAIIEAIGRGRGYNEKWQNIDQKEVDKIFQRQKKDLIENLDCDIIIDMTNMTLKGRRKVLQGFGKDFKKEAIVFLTGFEELERRNELRAKQGKFISNEVMLRMMAGFSIPTYEQFDEISWRL